MAGGPGRARPSRGERLGRGHGSVHGVSAANIPSARVNEKVEKDSSTLDKLSFQVVLPGVTLPMSDIGYYIMALLFCSVVHEAGHAIAAIQEGIIGISINSFDNIC